MKSNQIHTEILHTPKKRWFTLVELIIVITILAILATIAFISFQNYTKDTRDTKRITELSQIEKWLEIYAIRNTPFPHPSEKYITVYSGDLNHTILIQWELWNEIKQLIQISNNPKNDPELNYTYTTNASRTRYQLTAYLEKDPNLFSFNLNPNQITQHLILQTYANLDFSKRIPYTRWNYVSIFNSNHQPLQEVQWTQTGSLNLTDTPSQEYTLLFWTNSTPQTFSWAHIEEEIKQHTWSSGGSTNNEPIPDPTPSDGITWTTWNASTVWSTGTITKDIWWTDYTYNLKVVSMWGWTTAIWTTQNMRHPVNNCLTTTTATWMNGTYSSCSVWNTTNWVIGYNDAPSDTLTNGLYYQWQVANQVCAPLWDGWHLPSDDEWYALENASKTSGNCNSWRSWWECDWAWWLWNKLAWVAPILWGYRGTDGTFNNRGTYGLWWSSLENSSTYAYRRFLNSGYATVSRYSSSKATGFSVLCLKN